MSESDNIQQPDKEHDEHFHSHEQLERGELATFAAHEGLSTVPPPLREPLPSVPRANPDDPPVRYPPRGPRGPLPAPYYVGLQGRIAIVQGQVFILAVIVITQLWLITDALYNLLSGRTAVLGFLALASFLGFVLAFVVAFWPRRRVERP